MVPVEAARYQVVPVCFQCGVRWRTSQSLRTSTIQSRRLSLFGNVAWMEDSVDAKNIAFALFSEDCKRRPGRPYITWLKIVWNDLKSHNLTLSEVPPYLHLATSEMWCWSGGRGILKKNLSLYYSIVYYYNGAQRYEQFYRLLCLSSTSVSSVFMVLYMY